MKHCDYLLYETLSIEQKTLFLIESVNSIGSINNRAQEIKQKVLDMLSTMELPKDSKLYKIISDAGESFSFDLYIMRTFGFGITALINPVLKFLNTFKIEISDAEIALLVIAIVFSLVGRIRLAKNELLHRIKNVKLKNILSGFKGGVDKLLEYMAYASIALHTGGSALNLLNGQPIDWKTTLAGIGTGLGLHTIRSLFTKVKK